MLGRKLARFLYSVKRLQWRLSRPLTVGVRLLAVEEGRVLLVRHSYMDGWYLPGGGLNEGESLGEALSREAAEEAGAVLRDPRLFGVYSSFHEEKSDHIVVFFCEDFTWRAGRNREIEEVDCFGLDQLAEGISPGRRRRIAEFAAGATAIAAPW